MSQINNPNSDPDKIRKQSEDDYFCQTFAELFDNFKKPDSESKESETIEIDYIVSEAKELSSTSPQDWFTVASRLRQHNRELLAKIMELETNLAESENNSHYQKNQIESDQILISEQTEELQSTQEQVTRLLEQLDKANQTAQEQQKRNQQISDQLQKSQEQVARLERECALLQEKYHQQNYKIIEAEKQLQELEHRLQRQQHYNLQFRSLLEQYLSKENLGHLPENLPEQSSLVPKIKAIEPWSNLNPLPETKKEEKPEERKKTEKKHPNNNWPSPLISSQNYQAKNKIPPEIKLPKISS